MEEQFKTRQTLLARVQNKDDEASWAEFSSYYHEYLYLICRRMSLNHNDAQEVVQKVMVKLWDKLPQMDCSNFRRFRGWLCTITGNAAKDFLRRQKTRSANEESAAEEIECYSEPDIERIADEEWKAYVVNLAMERAEKSCSKVAVAVFKDLHSSMSREEVARKHDIPVGTVSVYKHRVLSALCREIRLLESNLG